MPLGLAKTIAGAPKAAAAGTLVVCGGLASARAFWFAEPDPHLVATMDELAETTMVAALEVEPPPPVGALTLAVTRDSFASAHLRSRRIDAVS